MAGLGSETGSGNEAHPAPGESGTAEGADRASPTTPANLPPNPDHPRSDPGQRAPEASRRRGPEDEIERIPPLGGS